MLSLVLTLYISAILIKIFQNLFLFSINHNQVLIFIFGFIGIPIHELSHLIFAILFRHEIGEIRLFEYNHKRLSGYVKHRYKLKSFYQRIGVFFISIGPLIVGLIITYFLLRYSLSSDIFPVFEFNIEQDKLFDLFGSVILQTRENLSLYVRSDFSFRIEFIPIMIICFSIVLFMTPSQTDILNSFRNMHMLIFLIILVSDSRSI